MTPHLLFFSLIAAALLALLEIQIEGDYGWAEKLPTKRIPNPFAKYVKWPYITLYHIYLWLLLLVLFHIPYVFGFAVTLKNELLLLEFLLFCLFWEDILWFFFHKRWGVKKFFTVDIPWHPKKFLFITHNHWINILGLILFDLTRRLI